MHRRDDLPGLLRASIGPDWPPPLVTVDVMQRLKASLAGDAPGGWTAWYVLQKTPRTLFALGGFKSPPVNGITELSYTVLPAFHNLGYATEIVASLTHWAFSHAQVRCVFAETLPELTASRRVLLKNGFVVVHDQAEPGVLRFERRRIQKSELAKKQPSREQFNLESALNDRLSAAIVRP